MKLCLCAIFLGLAMVSAITTGTTESKDFKVKHKDDQYSGDEMLWIDGCNAMVRDIMKCKDCKCEKVSLGTKDTKFTTAGTKQQLDKLDDHIEKDGFVILGVEYEEASSDEDGTMTFVVTMVIFSIMMLMILGFFICMPWPNTPEKIAMRENKRMADAKQRNKEEEAEAKLKATALRHATVDFGYDY